MPHSLLNNDLNYMLTDVDDIQSALFELGHADSRITVSNVVDQKIAVEILALDNARRRFYWRPRDYAGADFARSELQGMFVGSTFRFQADGYGGVQVHFRVSKPQLVRADDGSPALLSPFPDQLKRIQRRNAFRVQVAQARLVATATWQPDLTRAPMVFQVRDLSIDGIGMRGNHPIATLPEVDTRMKGLVLNFGRHGEMEVDIVVHNLYPLSKQGDEEEQSDDAVLRYPSYPEASLSHVGGRFIYLDKRQETRLQKIVWALEKARAASRT